MLSLGSAEGLVLLRCIYARKAYSVLLSLRIENCDAAAVSNSKAWAGSRFMAMLSCRHHVPGSRYCNATRINESKGERWFCTVEEAVSAGRRAPRRWANKAVGTAFEGRDAMSLVKLYKSDYWIAVSTAGR